ncbi:MAG TPA: 50S ribosomal protein L9 [Verrucomicrobiae bacterium]|nr:50S ribosomal protein L9 [Verrucomicrobiae bacterium]
MKPALSQAKRYSRRAMQLRAANKASGSPQLTPADKRRLEALKQRRAMREAHEFNTMSELAKALSKLVCVVKVKTGEGGRMFGAVTPAVIADALKVELDISIDKRKIHTPHPIRTFGDHDVELQLHPEVTAMLKVRIEPVNEATSQTLEESPEVRVVEPISDTFSESQTAGGSANEAILADSLVREVAGDTTDVKTLCDKYQLKREELGRLTGFSLRALAEWHAGKLPSLPARRRLQEVRRLLDALAEIVKLESIPRWLHQPNPAFDRLTPLQVIELGEIDRLWGMVYDMSSGQPE